MLIMLTRFVFPCFMLFHTATIYAQLPENAKDVCPIKIGEQLPNINLLTADGKTISIVDIVMQKPAVLIFYRGGWCPYCNAHLAKIGEIEDDIINAGYQVLAISPDEPERLNITIDKKELKYILLSDGDGKLSTAMGIAFKSPEAKWKANQLEKHSGGKNPGFLPVPSIFVVDKKGEILFQYVNPDYKQRLDGAVLLAILKALK